MTALHTRNLDPEAARWGNQHGQSRSLANWQGEYDYLIDDWFPIRSGRFLDSLRRADLYPDLAVPTHSQHGGTMNEGSGPTLAVPLSVRNLYYLFGNNDTDPDDYGNSLDPRLTGGGINPAATLITLEGGGGGPVTTRFLETGHDWHYLDDGSDQGTDWRTVGFDDSSWNSGPSQLGYGDGDEATEVNFIDVDPGEGGTQKNATTYFRTTFETTDPTVIENFTLNYLYDDGIAIYLNGVEVSRENLPLFPTFDTYATKVSSENDTGSITLTPASFVAGTNTLSAEIHQQSDRSSDISFDLDLTGNPPGGGGMQSSDPVVLTKPGWLFSRSYDSATGEWSVLNTAFFTPDTEPAGAGNLVIFEINYHLSEPSTAAELAVSSDRDDYEFIELRNVGILRDFAYDDELP